MVVMVVVVVMVAMVVMVPPPRAMMMVVMVSQPRLAFSRRRAALRVFCLQECERIRYRLQKVSIGRRRREALRWR
jgi:hypothetical protein